MEPVGRSRSPAGGAHPEWSAAGGLGNSMGCRFWGRRRRRRPPLLQSTSYRADIGGLPGRRQRRGDPRPRRRLRGGAALGGGGRGAASGGGRVGNRIAGEQRRSYGGYAALSRT